FLFITPRRPPTSTLFPYTTLFRSLPRTERARLHAAAARWGESIAGEREVALAEVLAFHYREAAVLYTALEPNTEATQQTRRQAADRKSTRLNSSHVAISYAVFCLK